jgi:hypothetical protein
VLGRPGVRCGRGEHVLPPRPRDRDVTRHAPVEARRKAPGLLELDAAAGLYVAVGSRRDMLPGEEYALDFAIRFR